MKRPVFPKDIVKWRTEGRDRARELVRIRDRQRCRKCGKKSETERRLHVHHLRGMCGKNSRGYDSVNRLSGMITVCPKCHSHLHRKKAGINRGTTAKNIEKIRYMLWEGYSYDKVGKKFGVSGHAVWKYIKRHPA